MNPEDHRVLLQEGIGPGRGGTWADLGSGTGAFTAALAELMGGQGRVYSVDRDAGALRAQGRALRARFPGLDLELVQADFRTLAEVPALDGAVMANALHFQEDQVAALRSVLGWLKPGAGLIVVEYDIETANPWVPYSLPPRRLEAVCAEAGFAETRLLATRPSSYHGRVYSMACVKPGRS